MRPTPQDIQLMSKHCVLSFKPQRRLEWRGQDGQNETEQPVHSASLSDSITSSTRIRFSVHTRQRAAIIGGAIFEKLAKDADEAAAMLERGDITVARCHEFHCVGSLAGIYMASVLVMDNASGRKKRAFCNFWPQINQ